MNRQPYKAEKRRKEIARQKKQEEKRQKREEKKRAKEEGLPEEGAAVVEGTEAVDTTQGNEPAVQGQEEPEKEPETPQGGQNL